MEITKQQILGWQVLSVDIVGPVGLYESARFDVNSDNSTHPQAPLGIMISNNPRRFKNFNCSFIGVF